MLQQPFQHFLLISKIPMVHDGDPVSEVDEGGQRRQGELVGQDGVVDADESKGEKWVNFLSVKGNLRE